MPNRGIFVNDRKRAKERSHCLNLFKISNNLVRCIYARHSSCQKPRSESIIPRNNPNLRRTEPALRKPIPFPFEFAYNRFWLHEVDVPGGSGQNPSTLFTLSRPGSVER